MHAHTPMLDWVVGGGESGPHARECDVEWIADIARQCGAAGVKRYVKQDSGPQPGQQGRIPDALWAVKQLPDGWA
jgi:protein gp37